MNNEKAIRVGIVGAGYIADFHANAIEKLKRIELVAVCDARLSSAKAFASTWGVPAIYDSLSAMLEREKLDAIHLLVPPDLHHAMASIALKAGVHVFVEKPMCVSSDEADSLLQIALEADRFVAVNHNMLFASAYEKLRKIVHSGDLGPLVHVGLNFFQEVGIVRFGPFDSWMLSSPTNLLLEIGPHAFSVLIDLIGSPDEVFAIADRSFEIPGEKYVFRRWRVRMTAEQCSVDVNINLGPTHSSRTIAVHGQFGVATVDLDANTCVVDQGTSLGIDLDRYKRTKVAVRQLSSQAKTTLLDYAFSKLKLRRRGNPYQSTIIDSVAAFYSSIEIGTRLDSRISGERGRDVVDLCTKVIKAANVDPSVVSSKTPRTLAIVSPSVLVLGARGFIGSELVRQLVEAGYSVRAMIRGAAPGLESINSDRLELVSGNILNEADLKVALRGIDFVFHLARADVKTWSDYVNFDLNATALVAKSCQAMGVKRLVYTGTIDSYNAGMIGSVITENTPLDSNIKRRNYYARAKAAAELLLVDMHRQQGLPVVIVRPGIVIGRGGNPFHWGVGMWSSGNICEVWGEGENKLPFVLVGDVASALVRSIQVEGIEGKSYNLIDIPLISAREYLSELATLSGTKMRPYYRPIWRFYVADFAKWLVKVAVGHPDKNRIPSYADWYSRTQHATFDCTRARTELGWKPASDKDTLINDGIGASLQSWLGAMK